MTGETPSAADEQLIQKPDTSKLFAYALHIHKSDINPWNG